MKMTVIMILSLTISFFKVCATHNPQVAIVVHSVAEADQGRGAMECHLKGSHAAGGLCRAVSSRLVILRNIQVHTISIRDPAHQMPRAAAIGRPPATVMATMAMAAMVVAAMAVRDCQDSEDTHP